MQTATSCRRTMAAITGHARLSFLTAISVASHLPMRTLDGSVLSPARIASMSRATAAPTGLLWRACPPARPDASAGCRPSTQRRCSLREPITPMKLRRCCGRGTVERPGIVSQFQARHFSSTFSSKRPNAAGRLVVSTISNTPPANNTRRRGSRDIPHG